MFIIEFVFDVLAFLWRRLKWLILVALILGLTIGGSQTHTIFAQIWDSAWHALFGNGHLHLPHH